MPRKPTSPTARKPRADGERNRLHILEVAKKAFTKRGVTVPMDEIAKQAQVGPGTLYRHFPTREALLEAVYGAELEKLAEAERRLAATKPPVEALRAWMLLFVDYMATKQIVGPALNAMVGGPSKVYASSAALITGAIESLVRRAIESGEIRADLEPLDLLRALVGVSNVAAGAGWQQSARRLVEILIAGLKRN